MDIRPQGNSTVNVTVTLREDSVALEQEETFQLRLTPLNTLSMAMNTNEFLIGTIEVTIIDQDSESIRPVPSVHAELLSVFPISCSHPLYIQWRS